MTDLISKSALVDALAEQAKNMAEVAANSAGQAVDYYSGMKTGFASAAIMANSAPTIEPKKGKWKPFDLTWGRSVWACDACGETVDVPTLNGKPIFDYCPWCGAKMERSEDGET